MTTENNVAAQAGDSEPRERSPYVLGVKPSTWDAQVAAQAGDDPMRAAFEAWCEESAIRSDLGAWDAWQAATRLAQVSPRATADVERENLPHGHRDDFYLMANARNLAMEPIHRIKSMPNWVLAKKLFATGSTSAHEICVGAGIDPDSYSVERATTKPGA